MSEYLDSGEDAGSIHGRSGGKIGFFGTAPVVIQSVTATSTVTISQVATSGKWAFASSTAANNLVTQVQDLKAALLAYGFVATG